MHAADGREAQPIGLLARDDPEPVAVLGCLDLGLREISRQAALDQRLGIPQPEHLPGLAIVGLRLALEKLWAEEGFDGLDLPFDKAPDEAFRDQAREFGRIPHALAPKAHDRDGTREAAR